MNVAISSSGAALSKLVPDLYPIGQGAGSMSEPDADRMKQKIQDVVCVCKAAYERQIKMGPGTLTPDDRTKQLLSIARRSAIELLDDFDKTPWCPRFMRLRGLVCAAEIVADTYTVAKDCGSYEDCTLENAIEICRDYAVVLADESRSA